MCMWRRLGAFMYDMCQFKVTIGRDATRVLWVDCYGVRTFGARSNFDWDFVKYL